MAKPDRTAFALKYRAWLIPVFVAVLLFGFMRGNMFAVAGGVFGLIWVAWAIWTTR